MPVGTNLSSVSKDQLERVCRMYKSNVDAGRAMGISSSSVGRLCKRMGVESPSARNRTTKPISERKKYREKLYHRSANHQEDS